MKIVVGVDGGNTKTVALAVRLDGTVVGTGRGGSADIYYGEAESGAAVLKALREAHDGPLEALVLSMAGVDFEDDQDWWRKTVGTWSVECSTLIVNDAIGALRAATPTGDGVVVVCGTGVATGARNGERSWHSSFWQETQGAVHLVSKAISAIMRADLGIDPPTALTQAALQFFQVDTVADIVHRTYARHRPEIDTKPFVRNVLDVAQAGDPTASRIVWEHGQSIGDYALVAARKVGLLDRPFPLALAGGVLKHPSGLLNRAISERASSAAPHVTILQPDFEPAAGAVLLALEQAGVTIDSQVLSNLRSTFPPHSLFATD